VEIMRNNMLVCFLSAAAAFLTTMHQDSPLSAADGRFSVENHEGNHVDVLNNGVPIAQYRYAYQPETPESLHETYKPYLHIMNASGEQPITKGAGGQFTHHRGIFIGWSKIRHEGNTYDRWHMRGGEIVHQKFLELNADDDSAVVSSETAWHGADRKPILTEQRVMTFHPGSGSVRFVVDFESRLTPTGSGVVLDGDPEHAGVQFRPSNNVDRKKTVYHFPTDDADPKQDRDYPWVGETFTLDGEQHSIVHVNHPENPKDTRYSAYRDYGRFGAFFVKEIPEGETLTVRYRFLIIDGEMPEQATLKPYISAFQKASSGND